MVAWGRGVGWEGQGSKETLKVKGEGGRGAWCKLSLQLWREEGGGRERGVEEGRATCWLSPLAFS